MVDSNAVELEFIMTKKAKKSSLMLAYIQNFAATGSLVFQSQIGRLEKLRAQRLSSGKIQRRLAQSAR